MSFLLTVKKLLLTPWFFFPSISAAAFVIVTVAGSCTGARLTRLDEADLSEGVNVGDSRI